MINVALLSSWHVHANDYAQQAAENEHVSIKMVWDEETDRGEKWAKELGVPFEKDLQVVLADDSIDAVIVNTPTNMHKEVITAVANNKKHVFTEKVLAFTVADCEDIYQAVEAAGVELMVSLPRLTANDYVYAQKALDQGWIGELTTIRCRLAHNGAVGGEGNDQGWLPERFFNREEAGGGALIDLGAHPIYLTNRLAGPVEALSSRLKQTNQRGVDDNATVSLEYASGALGVIETGFLSYGSPFQLELYGTGGVLLIEEDRIRMKSNPLGKHEWTEPDDADESLPMPFDQWVSAIKDGITPSIQKQDVIALTRVNEMAAKSQEVSGWVAQEDIVD